jgi:mono/diheme cytochrome c family protein
MTFPVAQSFSTAFPLLSEAAQAFAFFIAISLSILPAASLVVAAETMTPFQRAVSTPRGMLESPYQNPARVAKEGLEIYRSLDCGGCHGGGGGGGMAAPLTNSVWIYGDDDDTLFRVIALGTGSLSPGNAFRKQGFTRKGSEAVVGPMPPYGNISKSSDDLWKIIAWIRSRRSTDD